MPVNRWMDKDILHTQAHTQMKTKKMLCVYSGVLLSHSVQLSHVWLFETPWTAARPASLSITNSQSLDKFISVESVTPSKPSHPLSAPNPPAFYISQHQGLFQWNQFFSTGGQTIGASASVLPMNIQGQFPLTLPGLISLLSKGLSRVFFKTTVQKHEISGTQRSLWCNSHIHTWLVEKP